MRISISLVSSLPALTCMAILAGCGGGSSGENNGVGGSQLAATHLSVTASAAGTAFSFTVTALDASNNTDKVEASALCYLVAFDLDRFDIAYALGTEHPGVRWSDHIQHGLRIPACRVPMASERFLHLSRQE